MGQCYTTDLGFSSMTQAELDRLAVERCGVLGSIGYGYATHDRYSLRDNARFGWRLRVINTRGTGNCGTFVIVPSDGRTRELTRQGWIRLYQERLELSAARANVLSRAARGVGRTHEDDVIAATLDLLSRGSKPALVRTPDFEGSHRALHVWLERWIVGSGDWGKSLSFQRKCCALEWAHKAAVAGWYDVHD